MSDKYLTYITYVFTSSQERKFKMDTNKNDIFAMLESGTFYKGSDIKNGIKYSLFLKKFLNIHFASIIKFKKRFMDNLGGSISDEEYYKLEMDDNGNISIIKKD